MNQRMIAFFSKRTALIGFGICFGVLLCATNTTMAGPLCKPTGNMSMRLEILSAQPGLLSSGNQKTCTALGLPSSGAGSLVFSPKGLVLVYIRLLETSEVNLEALKGAGVSITHVAKAHNTVTAFVAPSNLKSISALNFVGHISEVAKPLAHQAECPSATTSEGDSQVKADQARQQFSVDGSGVTVGVLSTSFAALTTPTSLEQDIQSGDLPGTENPCGRTTPVQVIEDLNDDDSTDEGRAMAQIVHDLAPGANLAFATGSAGLFKFADNIKALRNTANADIIVDDIYYLEEPIYQDGPISVAITEVTTAGALYFTAAGNSYNTDESGHDVSAYEASQYRETPCPTLYDNGSAYAGMGDTCHNFDPSGVTAYQEIELANEGGLQTSLQWAEPWYGVVTDLDFILTDSSFNILASSIETNSGTGGSQRPFEFLKYQNTTGVTQKVRLIITRSSGSNDPRFKYIFHKSSGIISSLFHDDTATDTFGSGIHGHAGCNEAITLAAVPYDDASSPESFSTHGPFTVIYEPVSGSTPASLLSSPQVRAKPDLAATDGGANTFFGEYFDGAYRFKGTSAAGPHAAAVAALMKNYQNLNPQYSLAQSDCETYLENSAAGIANGGLDITGAGLVDAVAAINTMIENGGDEEDDEEEDGGGNEGGGGGGSGGGCFLNGH